MSSEETFITCVVHEMPLLSGEKGSLIKKKGQPLCSLTASGQTQEVSSASLLASFLGQKGSGATWMKLLSKWFSLRNCQSTTDESKYIIMEKILLVQERCDLFFLFNVVRVCSHISFLPATGECNKTSTRS
jgi:hypothetical protein